MASLQFVMAVGIRKFLVVGLVALGISTPQAQPLDEFAAEVDTLLTNATHPLLRQHDFTRDRDALVQLYVRKEFRPVWFRDAELTAQGTQLLHALRDADAYGLRSDDYDGSKLSYRTIDFVTHHGSSALRKAELDLALSIAAARFLRHLHFGRVNPRTAGFELSASHAPLDITTTIEALADGADLEQTLNHVEPPFLHYRLLKQTLQRYRLLAVDRELTNLPSFASRSIKLGEAYDGIPMLRRLLIALGDLQADATSSDTILDDVLAAGLRHFQQRHGLVVDGALGRSTFAALRIPLSARVQQLALTLERWRWLPEFNAPPIIVNIPQFRLFAFRSTEDRAADILQMDVIVGQTYPTTQTPIFTAEMKYVVFRPYWDVPPSIIAKEMLPAIGANPNYLDKENLELVSATESNADPVAVSAATLEQLASGKLRLRQRPGEDNALGLVKLMLPNPYDVYLHSTPAQRLFEKPQRAFSHGCIRVSDPVGLVEHVLRNEPGEWTRDKIEATMRDESSNNRHVFLTKPIPVLIVYGTAMALENGDVQFFEDIYGHDAKLMKLLR
ncbi:MAG TPA: L,D-transpeptidase family protein [Steroidobacteraceae bacterium]|nr:L,D-transpeptidase family protein [Steroidobacteraceae bacterium]